MTKEEREKAIEIIRKYECNAEHYEACEAIIKALEQQQSEECEDAISRQAVDELSKELVNTTRDKADFLCNFWEGLQKLPPVTPQPKTGRWITKVKSDLRGDMWPTNPKCSECGGEPYYSNTIYSYKFCPYCGAKMVESENEE